MDGSSPRHLQDEASSAAMQETPSNQQAHRLGNLPDAEVNASVDKCWCQLRDMVKSTALDVLGRARPQQQDWFDDNDTAIKNLLAYKNQLPRAYVDRPTAENKTAFCRSRHLYNTGCRRYRTP
ncbi:unnamed protein product [Schistocephalus solidus]|uniref:Uncharacterized protein n=1 Tax=Schistocephalus solidus TaxID=70667 RepID=A0A183TPN9_SCHSO|nr:unnamed protein product [Schistocephalus solidus]